MVAELKRQLATAAYDAMFAAYRNRSDEEALALGMRLMQRYPEQAKPLAQTEAVIAELKRRCRQRKLRQTAARKITGWIRNLGYRKEGRLLCRFARRAGRQQIPAA